MNFTQSFRLALKSLMTSKMRALLTMLGIIIGVGAVIVITSLGNGMQQMMNQQFEQLAPTCSRCRSTTTAGPPPAWWTPPTCTLWWTNIPSISPASAPMS